MAIDEDDNTVQIEHYDKARSWYCRDAVARVIDPVYLHSVTDWGMNACSVCVD